MKTKNIYADPTIDFAFKRIFGTERFKAATIGLLNSIIKDVNIVDVSFLNTEILERNNQRDGLLVIFADGVEGDGRNGQKATKPTRPSSRHQQEPTSRPKKPFNTKRI